MPGARSRAAAPRGGGRALRVAAVLGVLVVRSQSVMFVGLYVLVFLGWGTPWLLFVTR